jgi:hypothetical protein
MKPQQSPRIRLSGQIARLVTSEIETEKKLGDYFYQSSLKSSGLSGGEHSRNFSLLEDEAESSNELVASSLGLLNFSSCPVLIVEDDAGQREVTLEYDCYTLGRDPQNDICLRSQFASRFHAVLRCSNRMGQASVYKIIDGDLHGNPSTNGILVNGQR